MIHTTQPLIVKVRCTRHDIAAGACCWAFTGVHMGGIRSGMGLRLGFGCQFRCRVRGRDGAGEGAGHVGRVQGWWEMGTMGRDDGAGMAGSAGCMRDYNTIRFDQV